ncbi:hypothetical protein [Rhodomicrobium lacus]|uniref:hypothetical protein n=1 Tax=Rhodomicrobium lacus TaxID=2498452 RepID=UPI0026E2856F|nr:hypothetical protein [Rhodomicrobium lacus]WKW52070.1 hypothetical protein QMO75_06215 [Rhodomicrobium lacus]
MADQERITGEYKKPLQATIDHQVAAVAESNGHEESTVSVEFVTVADLPRGLYDHEHHLSVRDRGRRRYYPFAFDFDSTPTSLDDPGEHWQEDVKALHIENRNREIERLKAEYGERHYALVIQNTKDLGSKAFSIISYHNLMHDQARRAFVSGLYFPALVSTCALGERILNHLIMDLRDHYKSSPHYRRIYRKESFDDWRFAVCVLGDWGVLLPDVGPAFIELAGLRNRSVHFDPATYTTMREDALSALKTLGRIIQLQFGVFGQQPWFIDNTPGAQFIKRAYEDVPFVKTYIVPLSGFVGVEYGMDLTERGWLHLDYHDYGPGDVDDAEYARLYRARDPSKVVTREMVERARRFRLSPISMPQGDDAPFGGNIAP